MRFVSLKNVNKQYKGNNKKSVTDFNLDIEKGEFIAFVGPSGCGKSTTLRMIAGFEEVTEGKIEIDNKVVNDLLPRDRGIAPSRTPCGQIYLQKNGSPIPIEFVISIGRSITKTRRMIYFRYLRGFSLAVENFLVGILWSKS